jgi:hypothetical protein
MSELRACARRTLLAANAYAVIDSVAELPAMIDAIQRT